MMAKYINVDSLVVAYSGHTPDDEFSKGVDFVLDLLDSKPPADVRPVVRGQWVRNNGRWCCDKCTCPVQVIRSPFCPNCGANMRDETIVEAEGE